MILGEVLRRDELVQIDFGDELIRFAALARDYPRRVLVGKWLIKNGYVGVTVTAGFTVIMVRPLVTIMLVIYDMRFRGFACIAVVGMAGYFMTVMGEFLDEMGAVQQRIGGKEEKEKEYRSDLSFVI